MELWMRKHIYVEKDVRNEYITLQAIQNLKIPYELIEIDQYKDIFDTRNSSYVKEKKNQAWIFAKKRTPFLTKLSRFCNPYGYENVYYATTSQNCPYDCEYCYLQGMYLSGHLVFFTNYVDLEKELNEIPEKSYLCVSYDTDILALSNIVPTVMFWYRYAKENPNKMIEIRTKSTQIQSLLENDPLENLIISYTLSPEYVQKNIEHYTPSLSQRMNAIEKLLDKGYHVDVCFDPILFFPAAKKEYLDFIENLNEKIDLNRFNKISLGTFRMSKESYRRIQKCRELSMILSYPFETKGYMIQYPENIQNMLIMGVKKSILDKISDENKLYEWRSENEE